MEIQKEENIHKRNDFARAMHVCECVIAFDCIFFECKIKNNANKMHGNVTRQRYSMFTTTVTTLLFNVHMCSASVLPGGIVALIVNTDTFPFKWHSIKIYDYYFHSPFATDKFIMIILWTDFIFHSGNDAVDISATKFAVLYSPNIKIRIQNDFDS